MFISFLPDNTTELEFLRKVKSKYSELSFELLLGVTAIYSALGVKDLNKDFDLKEEELKVEHSTEDVPVHRVITRMVSFYPTTASLDFHVIYEKYLTYKDFIPIDEEFIKSTGLSYKFLLKFYVNLIQHPEVFKTLPEHIIDFEGCKSVFDIIDNPSKLTSSIKDYVKLSSDSSNLVNYSDPNELTKVLSKIYFGDLNKEKTYKLVYAQEIKPSTGERVFI